MSGTAELMWRWADTTPDAPALREGERAWTFEQLRTGIRGAMEELTRRGVRPGDRVLVVVPTSAEFVLTYHAVLALGATAVTVNPLCTQRELTHFVQDAGCSFAIGWHEGSQALTATAQECGLQIWVLEPGCIPHPEGSPEPASVATDDPAVLLYTSGTTGVPKGAILTHGNLLGCGASLAEALDLGPRESMGTALPLFHVFGLTCGLNAAVRQGATLTLIPRFDPGKALEVIARDQVTIFEGVPTMYGAMLHHPAVSETDTSSLRTCVSGGSSLPGETLREFEETFKVSLLEGYGLSETSPVASFNMLDRPTKPGTIGRAIPGCEMKLIGEDGQAVGPGEGVGEIAIRGDNVMKGYWNKPEETEAAIPDGWFRTGDLATVDDELACGFVDHDVRIGAGAHLGDSGTHLARADNADPPRLRHTHLRSDSIT